MHDAIDLGSEITSIFGDINDLKVLTEAMESYRARYCFSLAAQPLVQLLVSATSIHIHDEFDGYHAYT